MKKSKQNIVNSILEFGIILFPIGALITLFGGLFISESINKYSVLIFATGIILILIGSLADFFYFRKKPTTDYTSSLKANSNKILVNFDDCKVFTKDDYYERPSTTDYRSQTYNSIFNSDKETVINKTSMSWLEYSTKYKGKKKTFKSSPMSIDKDSFKIKIFIKKTTYIFIDKFDDRHYLFDLSFMKK